MYASKGFERSWRYCIRCKAIVHKCPCTEMYQAFYRPHTGQHSELDIDELEAAGEPEEDVPILDINSRNDLNVKNPMCSKSAQHGDFIGVDSLSLAHLPDSLRDVTLYVWLRNCIPSIVRIISSKGRLATGRATLIPADKGKEKPCTEPGCPYRTYGPHNVFGGLGIITNKHVVQNKKDAQGTKIEFFYTDYQTKRYTVKKEKGYDLVMTNRSMDYTIFSCFVHDNNLIYIVEKCDEIRNFVWRNIPSSVRDNSKKFAIIISHPHGTPKKVSIGLVIGQEKREPDSVDHQENVNILRDIYNLCIEQNGGEQRLAEYFRQIPDIKLSYAVTWYTTATCKGSSGAPVFMGDVVTENGEEINQAHTHRGVDLNTGYNYCHT